MSRPFTAFWQSHYISRQNFGYYVQVAVPMDNTFSVYISRQCKDEYSERNTLRDSYDSAANAILVFVPKKTNALP